MGGLFSRPAAAPVAPPPRVIVEYRDRTQERTRELLAALERQNQASVAEANAERERKRNQEKKMSDQVDAKRKWLQEYSFPKVFHKKQFERAGIADIGRLRIAIFGTAGSGKSCFIGTCERALENRSWHSVEIQPEGKEGTVILQDFLGRHFFRLVDTRGFFKYGDGELQELINICEGRIRPGQRIVRESDKEEGLDTNAAVSSLPLGSFDDCIHAVIIIIRANDPRLMKQDGDLQGYRNYLQPAREYLRAHRGIDPITVVTFADELKTDSDRQRAKEFASSATGSPEDQTYFIHNYTEVHGAGGLTDWKTELDALTILVAAIQQAERHVSLRKHKDDVERRKLALQPGQIKEGESATTTASSKSAPATSPPASQQQQPQFPAVSKPEQKETASEHVSTHVSPNTSSTNAAASASVLLIKYGDKRFPVRVTGSTTFRSAAAPICKAAKLEIAKCYLQTEDGFDINWDERVQEQFPPSSSSQKAEASVLLLQSS